MAAMAVLAIAIVVGLILVGIYNNLVRGRNLVRNAYAQIDVQLKRRYDLIPNLVETAKGYMKHEKETLEAVIKWRNQAVSANQTVAANPTDAAAMQVLAGAEKGLGQNMSRFLALFENYPDLKADRNMAQLTEELTSTENKVAFARQAFNDAVMSYNNSCEVFPASIIASRFGFAPATPIAIENPIEREAVKVKF